MKVESGTQNDSGCGGEEWKRAEGDLECSEEFELYLDRVERLQSAFSS